MFKVYVHTYLFNRYFLFLNENISLQEILGILLISISLIIYGTKQYFGKETDFKGFYLAVITGCLIASYSLVDGYGARVTQNPIGFYSVMTLINGLLFYAYARWTEKDIITKVINNGKKLFFLNLNLAPNLLRGSDTLLKSLLDKLLSPTKCIGFGEFTNRPRISLPRVPEF